MTPQSSHITEVRRSCPRQTHAQMPQCGILQSVPAFYWKCGSVSGTACLEWHATSLRIVDEVSSRCLPAEIPFSNATGDASQPGRCCSEPHWDCWPAARVLVRSRG